MASFDKAFWDDRYGRHPGRGGHGPNPQLVAHATGLPPGRALDAGCGEGADARWLAEQGWRVTAVDVARAVLDTARQHAERLADNVRQRIAWRQEDLTVWTPPEGAFDLVSAQYVHVPAAARERFFLGLAGSVAPGGSLLVVGHQPMGHDEPAEAPAAASYRTADLAELLDRATWEVALAEGSHQRGHGVTVHDTVLRATRRNPGSAPGRRNG
jgi:SAM-dependent methyltransferase